MVNGCDVFIAVEMCYPQVLTFGWREDIRVGDPVHTRKVCFDAVSHSSPVTLYDCHGMRGNQLWRYREVRPAPPPSPAPFFQCSKTTKQLLQNK